MTPKLWSVCEIMQYFNVCQLVQSLNDLEDMGIRAARVTTPNDQGKSSRDNLLTPAVIENITPKLKYLKNKCSECELVIAANRIEQRIAPLIAKGLTFEGLLNQLTELKQDIYGDLLYRRFLFVPSSGAEVLDGLTTKWQKIWMEIPSSEKDTRDAALSYAIGLYTSTIFHSMRIAEFGLRYVAKKMPVSITDHGKKIPIDFGTWEKIITNCNNKITAARKLPSNGAREKKLQYYSRAADHCTYMKDIWRNEVSHARKSYIEPEARSVLDRVYAFMEFLAAGAK